MPRLINIIYKYSKWDYWYGQRGCMAEVEFNI